MNADERNLLEALGFLENLADQVGPVRSQPHHNYCLVKIQKLKTFMRRKFVSLLLVVCHLPSLLSFRKPQAHLNLPMRRDDIIIINTESESLVFDKSAIAVVSF